MDWLIIVAWGALVGLDATSVPQVMISRPLPAAILLGIMLGEPAAGALIGGLLEAFSLSTLPMGAARYPESGTAAVAATGAYVLVVPGIAPGLILASVLFALGWERVAGTSVAVLRRINERIAAAEAEADDIDAAWVVRRHLTALGLDLARAALLTAVGWGIALLILAALVGHWSLEPAAAWGVLGAGTAAMVGSALSLFGGWAERRLVFLLGLACGVGLVVLT